MERRRVIVGSLFIGIVCLIPESVEGRQMCLSCSYQPGLPTYLTCVDEPWSWPGGNVRARCNFKCVYQLWKNTKTDEYTFSFRGCSRYGDKQKDGCTESGDMTYCYFSCEGEDYCNNFNSTVLNYGHHSHQQLSILSLFLALVAVVAVNWCFE